MKDTFKARKVYEARWVWYPTQCGKSIVMDTIEKALKAKFGANVVSEDMRIERNASDYESLQRV